MNEKLQKILDSIKAKTTERDNLLDKKEGFTVDDATKARGLNDEIKALHAQFELLQEAEGQKAWGDEPINAIPRPGSQKDVELLGFTQAGHMDVAYVDGMKQVQQTGPGTFGEKVWKALNDPNYAKAFMKYLRRGQGWLGATDLKDLELGIDSEGGYLAPPEMLARIIQRLAAPTRMAGLVSNITTSRSSIVLPKVNYSADDIYTTGFRTTWTGENPASDTEHRVDTEDLFGEHRIDVFTAMLSALLTNDMVEDAAFDLSGWVSGKMSETVELLIDEMISRGSGVNQPRGILVAPGTTGEPDIVISGSAAAVTADGLVDLSYALPEQYDTNARFVFNKTGTGKAIAKLKDGDLNYLFSNELGNRGIATARPSQLLGYPFAYNAFMPNPAANAYPAIFGDLTGYTLARRLGLAIQVLREKYAERNRVGLVGRLRMGGKVLEPFKMKVQKCAAA